MKCDIISEKDAPAPPNKQNQNAAEAASIVTQLKRGKVARVEPESPQTIRGLRINLARAAKLSGAKLQTWDVDGILYVKLI